MRPNPRFSEFWHGICRERSAGNRSLRRGNSALAPGSLQPIGGKMRPNPRFSEFWHGICRERSAGNEGSRQGNSVLVLDSLQPIGGKMQPNPRFSEFWHGVCRERSARNGGSKRSKPASSSAFFATYWWQNAAKPEIFRVLAHSLLKRFPKRKAPQACSLRSLPCPLWAQPSSFSTISLVTLLSRILPSLIAIMQFGKFRPFGSLLVRRRWPPSPSSSYRNSNPMSSISRIA